MAFYVMTLEWIKYFRRVKFEICHVLLYYYGFYFIAGWVNTNIRVFGGLNSVFFSRLV